MAIEGSEPDARREAGQIRGRPSEPVSGSGNAANVQEIVAGWREGRPVLDSLAEEQLVVADALDALLEERARLAFEYADRWEVERGALLAESGGYREALKQIESVRAFHVSREVSEMRRIAKEALG